MRDADTITLLRTFLVFPIAYAILIKWPHPWITVAAILIMFFMDLLDGYAAVRENSKGKVTAINYFGALLGNQKAKADVKRYKQMKTKGSRFGPRLDIAGDRVNELVLWITFAYVNIVPLFVLMLIVLRHAYADAFMGAKGTSSKMKSEFARKIYSSNIGRGGVGIAKAIMFSYLVLVYVSGWPVWGGYALIAFVTVYILLRGAAEIYENI